MNNKGAIYIIKNLTIYQHGLDDPDKLALDKAIEALEKQIPKTPDIEGDGYADGKMVYDTWICPNCGKDYEIECDNYDYCPNCGQAIDKIWEEENE